MCFHEAAVRVYECDVTSNFGHLRSIPERLQRVSIMQHLFCFFLDQFALKNYGKKITVKVGYNLLKNNFFFKLCKDTIVNSSHITR